MREIEELYLLYKKDIYKYLLYLTHDPNLSEDLLSETFVNAISSISKFKGKSTIKTWLFGIARNLWLENLRKNKKDVEYNDLLEIYISENLEDKILQIEKLDRIKSLLMEKDERTQRLVSMRIKGYSFSEISKSLGISESSAKVINFRTKNGL